MNKLQLLNKSISISNPNYGVRECRSGELSLLERNIALNDKLIRGIIKRWFFVIIKRRDAERLHLIGDLEGTLMIGVSSPVMGIDFKNGLVLTLSGSVYQLKNKNESELDDFQLNAIDYFIKTFQKNVQIPSNLLS